MTTIAGVTRFDRPVEEVFDFLADPRNEPRYNPLILQAWKTTPGAIAAGTRFGQRAASFGRAGNVDIELVEYRRPGHLGLAIRSPGMKVRGDLELRPEGSGCRVAWSWDFRPQGAWRLLGPVLGLAGRRVERRVWAQMKRHLDAGPGASTPTGSTAAEGDRQP